MGESVLVGSRTSRLDTRRAALVAAHAFADDPFYSFLLAAPSRRHRALFGLHRAIFAHLGTRSYFRLARDEAGAVIGVAAWLTTGGYPQRAREQLAAVPGTLGALGLGRALRVGSRYVRDAARAHPREPHWYLWVLAVEPDRQRRGVGSALMDDALALVDREGVGVQLETQTVANVPYYERYGFEVVNEVVAVVNGPVLYSMWRAPRAPGGARSGT